MTVSALDTVLTLLHDRGQLNETAFEQVCGELLDSGEPITRDQLSRIFGAEEIWNLLGRRDRERERPIITNDDLLAAGKHDARTCYAGYQAMTTEALRELQMTIEINQVHTTAPEGIAFNGGRLALIKWVLVKRHVEPDARD